MDLAAVMDDLASALATVPEFAGRAYGYPADVVHPPAAMVLYPDEYVFDGTYARGMDTLTFPALIVVGRWEDRSTRDNLSKFVGGSGTSSVKARVEAFTATAYDTAHVARVEFETVRVAGADFAAATFDINITGTGV
jgi:hypothetical protein